MKYGINSRGKVHLTYLHRGKRIGDGQSDASKAHNRREIGRVQSLKTVGRQNYGNVVPETFLFVFD